MSNLEFNLQGVLPPKPKLVGTACLNLTKWLVSWRFTAAMTVRSRSSELFYFHMHLIYVLMYFNQVRHARSMQSSCDSTQRGEEVFHSNPLHRCIFFVPSQTTHVGRSKQILNQCLRRPQRDYWYVFKNCYMTNLFMVSLWNFALIFVCCCCTKFDMFVEYVWLLMQYYVRVLSCLKTYDSLSDLFVSSSWFWQSGTVAEIKPKL